MKKLLAAACALMLLLPACAPQPADASLQRIKDKGALVVGIDETFKPMSFRNENNGYDGFDIDMAGAFCVQLGVKLAIKPIEWENLEQALSGGNVDCVWSGLSVTDERQASVSFGQPYMANRIVLVTQTASMIETADDLKGKKVVTQKKSAAHAAVLKRRDMLDNLRALLLAPDFAQTLALLETGGADCAVMDEVMAKWYITNENAKIRVLDEDIGSDEYGVGFRKGSEALAGEFNRIYAQLKREGVVRDICEKWFGEDVSL